MVDVYDEMKDKKEATCKSCPLYLVVGDREICNPNLYLSEVDKTTTSSIPKIGFKRGCGCSLSSKYNNPSSRCPLNKW